MWALGERLIAGAALDVYEQETAGLRRLEIVRERRAGAPPRQRHARDPDRDGGARRPERARRAGRRRAAHAGETVARGPWTDSGTSHAPPAAPVAPVMRRLAKAIDGLDEPAVEKIAKDQQEDAFQVLIATMLSAQTKDAVTAAASARLFRVARTPASMARLTVPQDSQADLPGELLPPQGRAREGDVPPDPLALRRARALHDGRAAHAAGRGPQDGEPGADSRAQQPGEHLRRHARPPHRQPPRLGADADARRNRARALSSDGAALVADHQPLSGHLGPERLPSGLSAVSPVRAARSLSENWRDEGGQAA